MIRMALRGGATIKAARESLDSVTSHPRHEFWEDDIGFDEINLRGVVMA